jgi:hypothetical protein
VCALVVRGVVFVKLLLSVCSGKNGNAEESIMQQLVHFVVRALPPEHMTEVALLSDAVWKEAIWQSFTIFEEERVH